MGEKERAGNRVAKVFAVVALECLDGDSKLGRDISKEINKSGVRVRFET